MGVCRWIRDGRPKANWNPGGHFRSLRNDLHTLLERFELPVEAALPGDDDGKRVLVEQPVAGCGVAITDSWNHRVPRSAAGRAGSRPCRGLAARGVERPIER